MMLQLALLPMVSTKLRKMETMYWMVVSITMCTDMQEVNEAGG